VGLSAGRCETSAERRRPTPGRPRKEPPQGGGNLLHPIKLTDATDLEGCTTLHLRQTEFGRGGIHLRVSDRNVVLLISGCL
jgi:hypothetical protein